MILGVWISVNPWSVNISRNRRQTPASKRKMAWFAGVLRSKIRLSNLVSWLTRMLRPSASSAFSGRAASSICSGSCALACEMTNICSTHSSSSCSVHDSILLGTDTGFAWISMMLSLGMLWRGEIINKELNLLLPSLTFRQTWPFVLRLCRSQLECIARSCSAGAEWGNIVCPWHARCVHAHAPRPAPCLHAGSVLEPAQTCARYACPSTVSARRDRNGRQHDPLHCRRLHPRQHALRHSRLSAQLSI